MQSRIEVIEDVREFAAFETGWNCLAAAAGSPLLRHNWMYAAAYCFHDSKDTLKVLAVYDDTGELCALAPLVLRQTGIQSSLTCIGSTHLFEPAGLLYRDREALRLLLKAAVGLGYPLQLHRVPAGLPETAELKQLMRWRGLIVEREEIGSPYLEIRGSWRDFEAAMPSRRRGRLRRAARQAAELGELRFEVRYPESSAVGECYQKLLDMEAASWKAEQGTAISADERYKRFFSQLSSSLAERREAVFCFMYLDDIPAAALLAIVVQGGTWILKTSYDKRFSRCSPGILLMHSFVEHAFERGLTKIEFLGVAESWIEIWTSTNRSYRTIGAYGFNMRGLYGLSVRASSYIFKSARRRIIGEGVISDEMEKSVA